MYSALELSPQVNYFHLVDSWEMLFPLIKYQLFLSLKAFFLEALDNFFHYDSFSPDI